jgi:hypothetical protein
MKSIRRNASIALLALGLVFPATAVAGKTTDSLLGPDGDGNGELAATEGLAVNHTGAGGVDPGTLYVVDQGNNRVAVFNPDGSFDRAWGWDVVESGGNDTPADEFEESTQDSVGAVPGSSPRSAMSGWTPQTARSTSAATTACRSSLRPANGCGCGGGMWSRRAGLETRLRSTSACG